MPGRSILSVDCGTQSLRAMLFSETGALLASSKQDYDPYIKEKPGRAEQDPEVYWTALCRACKQLKSEVPEIFAKIAGVGVAAQRNSMINVDKNGNPLRPLITWLDQRRARPFFPVKQLCWFIPKHMLKDFKILVVQRETKGNWIKQNQPDIWKKTHKYLQLSGFLNYRLTGVFGDSVASQIGHIPFDYRKLIWAKKKWQLANICCPVERDKLPDLIQPGEILGKVTPKASEETGIAKDIPVIACGSDKGCETIGSGVIDEKKVSLSFGTIATVQTTTKTYFESIKYLPPYPAPIPGFYNPEMLVFRGFWMITWFKEEFAYKEVQEAEAMGIAAEEVLDRHLAETEPGAMGLVVQPLWNPGVMPPYSKGAMIGFGDVHTKAHIYRAVIEGLGFGLLDGLRRIEKKGKFKVEQASVSGGASQSDEICKIMADIFNLPMVKGTTHETTGLGAAIITAVGLGLHGSFEQAINVMVKPQKIFEPDPQHVKTYRALYERVYAKMLKTLAPLYENIRDITGYPE